MEDAMILGLATDAFTTLHVLISLAALVSGLIVAAMMIRGQDLPMLTSVFLATTVLTSASGFAFHSKAIGPPHIVGAISLMVLTVALLAYYGRHLQGAWRPTYLVTALLALYFNGFVAVVQAFDKLATLHALAPAGKEPPFCLAQGLLLLAFVGLGFLAFRNFRPAPGAAGSAA
jgi:hypothetical protein